MSNRSAYYSEETKSWVRLERQEDGEWCHTSGYGSERAALEFDMKFVDRSAKAKPMFGPCGLPSFLEDDVDSLGREEGESSSKKPRRRGR